MVDYLGHRESAKLILRRALLRVNMNVTRDPAHHRLARTLDALGIDRVLDVGANVGQFGSLIRASGFRGRIDSFEPLPDASATLMRRASRDRDWGVHSMALGATAGSITLNVSGNSYSSSILRMTPAHLAAASGSHVVAQVEVPIHTLAEMRVGLGIDPRRTLLKIDTQGYESEVLAGAGPILDDIAAVQLELSMVLLYEGQKLFDELRKEMTARGLSLFSIEPGIADAQGRMLQCDGLFVREERLLRSGVPPT